jgi:drug/metabolite transporter (DMT)-like permease
VDLEEKYAIALGILSILLWAGGTVLARSLAHAPARIVRTVVPIAALLTLACYAVFVAIARHVVKG